SSRIRRTRSTRRAATLPCWRRRSKPCATPPQGTPACSAAASRPREIRDPEALAIRARSHPRRALEEAAEERRVLVADAPADLVDRRVGAFQPALGVLDAQALHVGDRREAGGTGEAALEGALGQARALDHFLDRLGHREMPP